MKQVKNNSFYLFIFFNILLRFSIENICDRTKYCSNCSICGKDINNYCSCSFNNAFCINEEGNNDFLSDFLFDYDQCENKPTENNNICGSQDINLELRKNKTIKLSLNSADNILCYYNVKNINNNNNNLYINIKKESQNYLDLSIYFVYYFTDNNMKISTISNIKGTSNFYYNINEPYVESLSVYISIQKAENINDFSIDFYEESNYITKVSHQVNSNKIIKIVMIIITSVFGVVIIIILILIIRKNKCKKFIKENSYNINNGEDNKKASPLDIEKRNKEIMQNLYMNELSPKIYYRNDFMNENYKCTICLENLKEGSSFITTTKCGHKFHFNCFKDWIGKNIISPKCPNCNKPIIKEENVINKSDLNATNPGSTFGSNINITKSTNLILNNTNMPIERCGTTSS